MSRTRLAASLVLLTSAVSAAIVGGIFQIPRDVVGVAGSSLGASGGGFVMHSAPGQTAVSHMTGGAFDLQNGYLGSERDRVIPPGTDDDNTTHGDSRFDVVEGRFLGYHPGEPFEFTFNHAIDTATLAAGVTLELVEFPLGVELSTKPVVALTIDYNAGLHHLTCAPASGSLEYNAAYRLTLSTQILDINGLPLPEASVFAFSTLANQAVNTTLVASDLKTKVTVPAGAVATDFFTILRVDPVANPERMDLDAYAQATEKAGTSYDDYSKPIAGAVREFTAYAEDKTLITHFEKPVTIEIPFTDADHDGVVDHTDPPVRVDSMAVWWLDETRKLWVRLPNPVIDEARGVLSAQTIHFSAFALIGAQDTNVTQIRVYPVPFRPNGGDPARYGLASEGIHFDNLPDTAEITIYTLTGRKVKSIHHTGLGEERWLAVNDDGSRVASGVYRYIIKSGNNKKLGRLVVVW